MMTAFPSFGDWAASEGFNVISRQISRVSQSGVHFIEVDLEEASPDPATGDMTIQFCKSGSFDLESEVAGKRFNGRMIPGMACVAPPGEPLHLAGEGLSSFQVLALPQNFLADLFAEAPARLERLEPFYGRPRAFDPIADFMRGFRSDLAAGILEDRLLLDTMIFALLLRLTGGNAADDPHRSGGLASWQLRRVNEALCTPQVANLSLPEMAAIAGLSPYHFCRAFKRSTGTTPQRYRQLLVIDRARDRLARSADCVTDIALDLGYGSSQAFARAFRRETGYSPAAYREEARA
ncbi:helix-turn-helix domain-containing protein [Qipengyuania qiaonensis]|uniref:AraC family transcriptional regulator n=1 Tax=Qipengyuania qiaonensis TaxID=2867240 RepID=A0ABS7J2Z2_9SPHN|nr:AraC family transcriptional regulator [Qipengyuania qiaonensis]MBX7481705.1 AraC family transcriptional regulator [Qipengyuania qiaonensis]